MAGIVAISSDVAGDVIDGITEVEDVSSVVGVDIVDIENLPMKLTRHRLPCPIFVPNIAKRHKFPCTHILRFGLLNHSIAIYPI